MSVTSADAEHEARHCVAAWYMGRRVERAALDLYALDQGVVRYSCPERDYGAADLVINMVGWLGDPDLPERAAWPEPWPPRINAPEGVGVLTRRLGLSQAAYERCCQIAEELVEQPAFKEAVALVARALRSLR